MKSCSRWIAILAAWFCFQAELQAQYGQPYQAGMDASQAVPMQTDLWLGGPGRLWLEFSAADSGLGYQGSYATIGGKSRLWDDYFDGRWLAEMQANVSVENGGFFGNFGFERVFSVESAGADLVVGGWYDYDSDVQGNFGHTFNQFGVNAAIKTLKWDIVGNGYFPVGTTDYTQGDPTGEECFFEHSIVLQAGIDSALRGFDGMLRWRPEALGLVNGAFEVGGYAYGSDLIDDFGGVRVRGAIQILNGLTIVGELNHDNRFDLTGVVQFGWQFGTTARGEEYAGLGRDLEPTIRNDHIVRYQQDVVLAIDPDTGRPYDVWHVNNLADPAFADGSVETPFTTLAEAEAASVADDIIFVYEGNGTTGGMNAGIVLKDGQLLLGDGVEQVIPIQNGQFYSLCTDLDGLRPRLGNPGGTVVTLANRNTVRGIIIDGNFTATNGIEGDASPAGPPITDGIIEDVTITNVTQTGISLNTIAGDWQFARNEVTGSGLDGVFITNAQDPTSTFNFEDNNFSTNGGDGLHLDNFDGTTFDFVRNTTDGNGRDGVHLETYLNGAATGADIFFASPNSSTNGRDGIFMQDIDGDVLILNPDIQGNLNAGVRMINVTNSIVGDETFIGTSTGGTSNLSGNGIGVSVQLNTPGAVQQVTITDSTINNSGTIGVLAEASGAGTVLTTDVIDNFSVSNSGGTGLRFTVAQGALHNVTVENTFAALTMNSSGTVAGNGIDLLVGDESPTVSTMNAFINNINIAGTQAVSMFVDVEEDGLLNLLTTNVNMTNSGGPGIITRVDTDANGDVSQIYFDNVEISGVGGAGADSGSDGVRLVVFDGSTVDFSFTNGTILDDYQGFTLPTIERDFVGFDVDVAGGASTLARIFFQNNEIGNITAGIAGFTNDGIQLTTSGASHTLVTIDGNFIHDNGPGVDPLNLPYFDGVDVTVSDTSKLNLILTNNTIINNWERSFELTNSGLAGAMANIVMSGNAMHSDIGEDGPAPITAGAVDMVVLNGAGGSSTCLSMSSNFFFLTAFAINVGAPGTFTLELDGLTNGVGVPIQIGPITPAAFGSTCSPAIAAEEAFFEANGFAPW